MNGKYATYLLLDPREGHVKIRYVGKTCHKIGDRLARHIRDAKDLTKRNHRVNWIRSVLKSGQKPVIFEVCRYDTLEAVNEAEKFLIKHMKELVNSTGGGDGGIIARKPNLSDEVVCELYKSGLTSIEIAKTYKTCKKRVLGVLRSHNLLRRQKGVKHE